MASAGASPGVTKLATVSCPIASLAPGASTTVAVNLRPLKRTVKSTAIVSSDIGEGSASGHSATTVVRVKQKRHKHER